MNMLVSGVALLLACAGFFACDQFGELSKDTTAKSGGKAPSTKAPHFSSHSVPVAPLPEKPSPEPYSVTGNCIILRVDA
jgi:hypothetical protein